QSATTQYLSSPTGKVDWNQVGQAAAIGGAVRVLTAGVGLGIANAGKILLPPTGFATAGGPQLAAATVAPALSATEQAALQAGLVSGATSATTSFITNPNGSGKAKPEKCKGDDGSKAGNVPQNEA